MLHMLLLLFYKSVAFQISLTSMFAIKLQDYFSLYQKFCDNLKSHRTEIGRDLWQKYCFKGHKKSNKTGKG